MEELGNEPQVHEASRKGMADVFIRDLPNDYRTQLGTWFKDGKELSGGQWQKIALSRAFMRIKADILILDEPTAAIDARAEAEIFAHFGKLSENRISIIISHRFSTVRMADHIIVLEAGSIQEEGSHEQLLRDDGQYAKLFKLQAKGLSVTNETNRVGVPGAASTRRRWAATHIVRNPLRIALPPRFGYSACRQNRRLQWRRRPESPMSPFAPKPRARAVLSACMRSSGSNVRAPGLSSASGPCPFT